MRMRCRMGGWIALASVIAGLSMLAPTAQAAGSGASFRRLGLAPRGQALRLVFPLHANLSGLEDFARAVSTVGSPLYGHYQPVAVLARRFGASGGERARVTRFLHRAGAEHVQIDRTGLFADATVSVGRAERLFGTSLARYESPRMGPYVAPAQPTRLPAALRGAATGVVGLDTQPLVNSQTLGAASARRFPRTARVHADNIPSGYGERTGTAIGCAGAIQDRGFTPNQYLDAYDYSGLHAAGVAGQNERVALIEIDGFKYSDLRTFAQCFGLAIPAINGFGVNLRHPLPAGGETTLDLQVLDAAAPGLKAVDVYESRARPSDVLESLTAPLQNAGRVPEVISASLGACEPASQLAIGRSGIRAAEGALALATASGISVLAASGDDGSSSCLVRGAPIDALAASYPASSPFVTAVGGTNFVLNAANQIQSQTVWNDAPYDVTAGGGGNSVVFRRPSYQRGFVRGKRRALPDVSMLADLLPGYDIYCTAPSCAGFGAGPWIAVGGTSAASPLLAGGLAIVDQLLRKNGRQELGLANSLFYRLARRDAASGVFSDVRMGNNDLGSYIATGNQRPLGCCTATSGYDRASGLGSVDLGKLALLAIRNQPRVAGVGVLLPGQRPVARRRLVARVSCSRACNAVLSVSIGLPRGVMVVRSHRVLFRRRGRRKVMVHFSRAQVRRLRGALRSHHPIEATVVADVIDSGGNVEGISRTHRLRIRH